MLTRIRRVSRQFKGSKRRDSVFATVDTDHKPSIAEPVTFLGLPPELRNNIYEFAASDTVLSLAPAKPRKQPQPTNLLLVSKQTRAEYLPILLSLATCTAQVAGYDFRNLIRVLGRTSHKDMGALKSNRNLWVDLLISHVPNRDYRNGLRHWLDYRKRNTESSNILAWQYDVSWRNPLRPPRPAIRYTNIYQLKLDLLRTHQKMVTTVHLAVMPSITSGQGELGELDAEQEQLRACLADFQRLLTEAAGAGAAAESSEQARDTSTFQQRAGHAMLFVGPT